MDIKKALAVSNTFGKNEDGRFIPIGKNYASLQEMQDALGFFGEEVIDLYSLLFSLHNAVLKCGDLGCMFTFDIKDPGDHCERKKCPFLNTKEFGNCLYQFVTLKLMEYYKKEISFYFDEEQLKENRSGFVRCSETES